MTTIRESSRVETTTSPAGEILVDHDIDLDKAKGLTVQNLSGDHIPLVDLISPASSSRKTVLLFLRRLSCPTCFSYIILFSHLRPILNEANIKLVFITCHQDLSEVQVFLKSFAHWLRDLSPSDTTTAANTNNTTNVIQTNTLAGELYLDSSRRAYTFFGLSEGMPFGQLLKIRLGLYWRQILGYSHIGKQNPPVVPTSDFKSFHKFLSQYTYNEMGNQMNRPKNMNVFRQSPGIIVMEGNKMLYRFICNDQINGAFPKDPTALSKALSCPVEKIDQIVLDGLSKFKIAVTSKQTSANIPTSELVLGKRLGAGQESEVFHSQWMGVEVAVKLFHYKPKKFPVLSLAQQPSSQSSSQQDDTEAMNEKMLEGFANECALLMSFRHKNVINILGFGSRPPNQFLIVEYMPRGTLFSTLGSKSLTLDVSQKLKMMLDVAEGMKFLHSCKPKVVHRDLKSLNLLVALDLTVKISDFGVAKEIRKIDTNAMGEEGTGIDSTDDGNGNDNNNDEDNVGDKEVQFVGTIQWMPPEIFDNPDSANTGKGDIFAFGVIMWEIATRARPWYQVPREDVVEKVLQGERLPIPGPPKLSPQFGKFVSMCWHQNPKRRPEFTKIVNVLKKEKGTFTFESL